MVYVGGRLTGDNRKLMQEQQQEEDQHKKEFPGVHYEIAIKDVQVQLYNGDSALVTCDWYPTRVVPASLPPEAVKTARARQDAAHRRAHAGQAAGRLENRLQHHCGQRKPKS